MFDKSTILRSAHATARSRMANNRAWRSYRQAFADTLRHEWRIAKQAAAQAAVEAEDAAHSPLPTDVTARVAAICLEASYEPHTFAGHARFRALHAEADDLARAARAMMIPAHQNRSHHAC